MAIKKYFANADNTITNAFRASLQSRGVDANMGAADVLETFSIYGQASSGSTELSRILINFPVEPRVQPLNPEKPNSISTYIMQQPIKQFRGTFIYLSVLSLENGKRAQAWIWQSIKM